MGQPGVRPGGVYAAPPAFAPRTFGSPHGYGNVVFPGTGHAPGTFSPFSVVDPGFGARLTNTVSGFGSGFSYPTTYYGGGYSGGYWPGRGAGTVVVPYPVYVYPDPQTFVVPMAAPAPPPPAPQIIYVVPGSPERGLTTTAAAPQRESVVTYVVPPREIVPPPSSKLYLIALQNDTIYAATSYWLVDDTLHYRTSSGSHNQASLDQVDLALTERLNRERGVEFRLDR